MNPKNLLLNMVMVLSFCAQAQTGIYDKPAVSTYTPLSPNQILVPAMVMRQRYDNNADKVDALINYIFDLKKQTNDPQFLSTLDNYYQLLKSFYNQDLARMDNQIRNVQFSIQEEIDKYNRRVQEENRRQDEKNRKMAEANNYRQKANNEWANRNIPEALSSINRAIELDPDNTNSYYMKGNILLFGMWDPSNAIACFSKCIYSNPNAEVYYCRGMCYEILNNYKEAAVDYTRCITYDSKSLEAYYRRGIVRSALDDRINAIKDYDFIINFQGFEKSNFKDIATVYNNKAFCLVELGNYDEALPLVNKALELDQTLWYIWDTRGELYYHIGKYQSCIQDMNKAISIEKGANSYYYRGLANIKLKRKTVGCADLSKSLELGKEEAIEAITVNCK